MSFIKHGDGKIVSIVDGNELTDDQKKLVKDSSDISIEKEEKNTDKESKN